MAKNNVEIEIRISVNKTTWDKVRKYLIKKAKFSGGSRDIDKYWNLPEKSFLKTKHPIEYLRIRKGSKGSFINYKYNYLNEQGKKTHADEFETGIEKAEQAEKIFSALGYKNFMTIDKKRESYVWGKFEVDLDEVKGLGFFVEIEAVGDSNVEKAAEKLGLDTKNQDNNGYVLLAMKKQRLI